MKRFISLILLSSLLSFFSLFSQTLTLAEPFNEGAVLQRNAKVKVWGNATPGEEVNLEIQGKTWKAKTTDSGEWNIIVSNLKEGGPYQLTVNGKNEIIHINEIYVGEVWIAGGQSNMGWTLEKSENGDKEIANATNENIHFLLVPNVNYEGHHPSGNMNWKKATSENVGSMSGVAYFFAKELQEKLNVPIGIICCYKGGTAAEVWMSRETLLRNPEHAPIVESYETYIANIGSSKYEELYADYEAQLKMYRDSVKIGFPNAIRPQEPMGERHYKRPYGLYNTMVKRILPYTAKGVIWYQGEANAPRAEQYQTLFPTLINEWRSNFENPTLPFYFVQLSNYDHPGYGIRPLWAELREAQLKTWQTINQTHMVVSIDVGEKNDIHPIYKEPVGKRLSLAALNQLYGYKIPYSGPVYKKTKFKGNKAIVSFDFIYQGLTHQGELKGFTICDERKEFVPAKAYIQGNKIIVYSEKIEIPIAVRYNWGNWVEGNLYNSAGLPATPFRTDNFPLISSGIKSATYK